MAEHWFMLTVVGRDRAGIVAQLAQTLFRAGADFGEASMLRLGGNFTIMLMVHFPAGEHSLAESIKAVAEHLQLRVHIDPIDSHLHENEAADVVVSISGADQAGIVAGVTTRLAAVGLDILNLDSTVAGSEASPVYVMRIEGRAREGIEALEPVIAELQREGLDAVLHPVDMLIA